MTPTPEPGFTATVTDTPLLVLAIMILLVAIAAIFVYGLLKAGNQPPPTALVIALSLLTFFALSGAIVTESTELATLAATGLGAIAGAVSSQFDKTDRGRPEKEPHNESDLNNDGNGP